MIPLPLCRWRGEANALGRYPCSSAKLLVHPDGVSGDLCRQCPYANHEPVTGPSLFQKAANFAGAVVQHVAAGLPTVSDVEHAARLAACEGCDQFNRQTLACAQCGCNMPAKARWAEQRCPLSKWPVIG